jgi:hypothetical protein
MSFLEDILNSPILIKPNVPESLSGEYYLKGIIHYYVGNEFDVIHEEFFYSGLEPDGHFLSQSDVDVYLKRELEDVDCWGFVPEKETCYSVLFKFNMVYSKNWTDNGYEYDSTTECIELKFIPITCVCE